MFLLSCYSDRIQENNICVNTISELIERPDKGRASEKILYLARHLSQLVEGYSFVLRGSGKNEEPLSDMVSQSLFNVEFRMRAHRFDIIEDYES